MFNHYTPVMFTLTLVFEYSITIADKTSHQPILIPRYHSSLTTLSHTHTPITGESIRDSGSFTDSYSQNVPPRSATPESPPQIPRVSFKPMVQLDEEEDTPYMEEVPPSNTVVLSDLYALTTKVSAQLAIWHGC